MGAARRPSKVLILESETLGVPKKEMSGPASPLGEAYEPSPPAAQTRSASRAGGRRGRGRSLSGQPTPLAFEMLHARRYTRSSSCTTFCLVSL